MKAALALLILLGLAGPVAAQGGAVVPVPGTSVSLTPPPGYAAASGYSGFANAATGGSIVVVELPKETYAVMAFDADVARLREGLARSGIAVDTARFGSVGATDALLVIGSQTAGGTRYTKWIAVIDAAQTVMLTVQVPQGQALTQPEVDALFASVVIGAPPSLEAELAALPYELTYLGPFRVVDTLGGIGVTLTIGAADIDPDHAQPSMIVSGSLRPAPAGVLPAAFAELRMRAYPGMTFGQIGAPVLFEHRRRQTVELVADAHDASGTEFGIVQWISFDDAGYLIASGMARREAFDALLPEMRRVFEGIATRNEAAAR